jgi:hypothetical protein
MTLLMLLLLSQAPSTTIADPSVQSEKVTTTKSATKRGLDVNIIGGSSSSSSGGGTIDGGDVTVHGSLLVYVVDAGPPLNINPPASLPLPTGASTAARQDTGNTSLSSIDAQLALIKAKTDNIDVAFSTRTKPADQQHVIIDSSAPVAVTGTFWQSTQPVSAAALPLPSGAATDATLSQLLDGGVGVLGRATTGQVVPIAVDSTGVMFVSSPRPPPLNPFLPRCNPVRRTGCQP